ATDDLTDSTSPRAGVEGVPRSIILTSKRRWKSCRSTRFTAAGATGRHSGRRCSGSPPAVLALVVVLPLALSWLATRTTGAWQTVEGVVTEAHPPDGEDTFGWLVVAGQVACYFAEHEALPASEGQRVKIRGRLFARA